jgi:isoleucyl-tRNA synthetase
MTKSKIFNSILNLIFSSAFNELYIVCEDTVESLQKILGQPVQILCKIDSSKFDGLFYRCVHHNELALPFLKSSHVTSKEGTTGLVHTSFAHGFDDYKVCL